MNARRKAIRHMARTGERAAPAPMLLSEFRTESTQIAERLLELVFERQPVNPGAVLLALEVVRQHVTLFVDESDIPAEGKARFWEGVASELKAYHDVIEARRS